MRSAAQRVRSGVGKAELDGLVAVRKGLVVFLLFQLDVAANGEARRCATVEFDGLRDVGQSPRVVLFAGVGETTQCVGPSPRLEDDNLVKLADSEVKLPTADLALGHLEHHG